MSDQPTAEHTLVGDEQALRRLRELRGSIDNLDAALVHLLAERFKCTQQVGELSVLGLVQCLAQVTVVGSGEAADPVDHLLSVFGEVQGVLSPVDAAALPPD